MKPSTNIPPDVGDYYPSQFEGPTVQTVCQVEAAPCEAFDRWAACVVSIPADQEGEEDFDVVHIHAWCGHRHRLDSGRMLRCLDRLDRSPAFPPPPPAKDRKPRT